MLNIRSLNMKKNAVFGNEMIFTREPLIVLSKDEKKKK